MRRSIITVLLTSASIIVVAAASPLRQPAIQARGAFIALSVKDAAAMSAWYRDNLDLRITASGNPVPAVKFAILQGEGVVVEIIEHADAKSRRDAAPSVKDNHLLHGIFKAGLIVDDLDATYRAMRDRKVPIAYDIMAAKDVAMRSFSVRDPEGNMLQFFGR